MREILARLRCRSGSDEGAQVRMRNAWSESGRASRVEALEQRILLTADVLIDEDPLGPTSLLDHHHEASLVHESNPSTEAEASTASTSGPEGLIQPAAVDVFSSETIAANATTVDSLTLGPDDTLTVEIGSGGHTETNVTNHASLNGTLSVEVESGFTPSVGDSFTFLTYGSVSGNFSDVQGLQISPTLHLIPIQTSTEFQLLVSDVSAGGVQYTVADTPSLTNLLGFFMGGSAVSITGSVTIYGNTLAGTFSLARPPGGGFTISSSNFTLILSDGSEPIVTVTNGNGTFTVSSDGVNGNANGNVTLSLPGVVPVEGVFGLEIDTTGGKRDVSVSGTNLTLSVAGQELTGSFTFQKVGEEVTLTLEDVETTIAGVLKLSGLSGTFTSTSEGLTGEGTADVEIVGVPDVVFEANLGVQINTIPGQEMFIARGENLTLNVPGVEIKGSFVFERSTIVENETPVTVVAIGASSVQAFLGVRDGDAKTGLELTGGSGGMLLRPAGLAIVAEGLVEIHGIPDLSIEGDLAFRFNNTGGEIKRTIDVINPGDDETVQVELNFDGNEAGFAGQIDLVLSNFLTINGLFMFSRTETENGSQISTEILVAATGVAVFVGSGRGTENETGVHLKNGKLGLIVFKTVDTANVGSSAPSRYALVAEGEIEVAGLDPSLAFGGSIQVRVNKTGEALNRTIETAAGDVELDFTSTGTADVQQFGGSLSLSIQDFVSFGGNFSIQHVTTGTGSELVIAATGVTAFMGLNQGTADAVGLQLTDGQLGLLIIRETGEIGPAKYALVASGTVALVGLSGLDIEGSLNVRINKTGTDLKDNGSPRTISTTDGDVVFEFDDASNIQVFGGSLTFSVKDSQNRTIVSIGGTVTVTRTADVVTIEIVTLTLRAYNDGDEIIAIGGTAAFEIRGPPAETERSFKLKPGSVSLTTLSFFGQNLESILPLGSQAIPLSDGFAPQSNHEQATPRRIGPLQFINLRPTFENFDFSGGQVSLDIGLAADQIDLIFGQGNTASSGSTTSNSGGLIAKLVNPAGSFTILFDISSLSFSVPGKFSFSADSALIEVPNVIRMTASGITIGYDPKGPSNQTLVTLENATITVIPLNVQVTIEPFDTGSEIIPGLVVRMDGFRLGRGTLTITQPINLPAVSLTNPFLSVADFEVSFINPASFSFDGEVSIGAQSVTLGVASVLQVNGTGVVATLEFDNNVPTGFRFEAATISIQFGSFVTFSGTNVRFNPGAASDEVLAEFQSLSVSLNVASLSLSGSASNFAIRGDGSIQFGGNFTVGFSVGSTTPGSLGFPSFLPVQLDSISLTWPEFDIDTGNFRLTISMSAGGSIGPMTLAGSVTGLVIDFGLLAEGKFPIVDLQSFMLTVGGNLFGGQIEGTFVGGIVKIDEFSRRIDPTDQATEPAQIIFYGLVDVKANFAGKGFGIRLGVSQLGLHSVYFSAEIPILLEPNSGLTLGGLRGGVTFNAIPFPSITDPKDLRSALFQPTGDISIADWQRMMEQQIASGGGDGYVFSADVGFASDLNAGTLPSDLRTQFLNLGFTMPADLSITSVGTGLWLIQTPAKSFLIEQVTLPSPGLNVSTLAAFLAGDSLDGFADGAAAPENVRQAFIDQGRVLPSDAIIEILEAGQRWRLSGDNGDVLFLLEKKGDIIAVTGGGGSLSAMDGIVRIEAGATLYSQYLSETAFQAQIDLIFTTDMAFLIDAEAIFGKTQTQDGLSINKKLFVDLRDLNNISITFLTDMPKHGGDLPTLVSFGGNMQFQFLDSSDNPISNPDPVFDEDGEPIPPGPNAPAKFRIIISGFAEFRVEELFLVQLSGNVELTIADDRLELEFDAQLAIQVGPGGDTDFADSPLRAAGAFVLDNSGPTVQFWGAMRIRFESDKVPLLKDAGITAEATVILRINTTTSEQHVFIRDTDPPAEIGGDSGAVTKVQVNIDGGEFAFIILGTMTFEQGPVSMRLTGTDESTPAVFALRLKFSQDDLELTIFADARLKIMAGETELLDFGATGLLVVNRDGFAAMLVLDAQGSFDASFSFSIDFELWINTTSQEIVYELPTELQELYGDAMQITVPAGAPKADGSFEPAGPYLVMLGSGNMTVASSFTMNGEFRIKVSGEGFELDVRASMSLAPLGTLTVDGTLHVNEDGVVASLLLTGNMSVGSLTIVGAAGFEINTRSEPETIQRRQFDFDTGTVSETALPHEIDPGTFQVFVMGRLTAAAFEFEGRFEMRYDGSELTVEAEVRLVFGTVGSVEAAGSFRINSQGAAGALLVTAGMNIPNVSFEAAIGVEFSTIPGTTQIQRYTGINPIVREPVDINGGDFRIFISGQLTVMNFTLEGTFTLIKSGSEVTVTLTAEMNLPPFAKVDVIGGMVIRSNGVVAALEITSDLSFGIVRLTGTIQLEINTTGARVEDVPFGTGTINLDPGVRLFVDGQLRLTGSFTFTGTFEIISNPQLLSITADASLNVFGSTLDVNGVLKVHRGANPGLVVDLQTTFAFGLSGIFEISGAIKFQINTRNITDPDTGIAAGSLRIAIGTVQNPVTLQLLGGVITLSGRGEIYFHNGMMRLEVWMKGEFFGVAEVEFDAWFQTDGDFFIRIKGEVNLGAGGTGVFGSGEVRFGRDNGIIHFWGEATVEGKIAGVKLAVITIGLNYNSETGRVSMRLSVTVWTPWETYEVGHTFTAGYLKVPPPKYLAGTLTNPQTLPGSFPGGDLYVNIGNDPAVNVNGQTRASKRNFATTETDEWVIIIGDGPAENGAQRITVILLGEEQTFDGVTKVFIYAGSGMDYVEIDASVQIPVHIDGGGGNDIIAVYSAAEATINGGSGNDTIILGPNVSATSGINGGPGDDHLVVLGTDGADTFNVYTPASDQVRVGRLAGETEISGVTGVSFKGVQINAGRGADHITVQDLTGSGVVDMLVDFGQSSTGDGAADTLIIHGTIGADTFVLSTVADASDLDEDDDRDERLLRTVRNGNFTVDLLNARRLDGDKVEIRAGAGNDTIDASAVDADLLELHLFGQAGNDRIIGSRFADFIYPGMGNNRITGGAGLDTFIDESSGSAVNTLVEMFNLDMLISDSTFIVGSMLSTPAAPGSAWAGDAEVEDLHGMFQFVELTGGAGNNMFVVGSRTGSVTVGGSNRSVGTFTATATLDGLGGSDRYIIYAHSEGDATINVSDTGGLNDGTDFMEVHGTDGADQFLVRANFVAVLHGRQEDGTFTTVQRINYNQNLNEGMAIFGHGGDDHFAVDDTSVSTTLDGGPGNDTFQIGQVFNADRQPPHVAVGDEVETTLTTAGYLTNGTSLPLTVFGGSGDDTFIVFRNLAPLTLKGGSGNDRFVVRAFIRVDTGEVDQAQTKVHTGDGNNVVEYTINAPVDIDGGEGFNTLIVVGTEADDTFVITADGIFGAGLFVTYINIQAIEVHGLQGDDKFYVLSTAAGSVVTLYGGPGNDQFFIAENAPVVISNDLRGHSGLIGHSIDTSDPDRDTSYDEVTIIGLSANVYDEDAPGVIILESGGSTRVSEHGQTDTYIVMLTKPPTSDVFITVSAPVVSSEDLALGRKHLLVSHGGSTPATAVVLHFTPGNWATPRVVTVHAAADSAAEGTQVQSIMHSAISADPGYHRIPIRSVPVTIIDNDAAGVILTESGWESRVLEGGFTDTYTVSLTRAPALGSIVQVSLRPGPGLTVSHNGQTGTNASPLILTFTSANWLNGIEVTITAVDDDVVQGQRVVAIEHEIVTTSGSRDTSYDAVEIEDLEVIVEDNDTPGVIIAPNNGQLEVFEGGFTDTYQVRLTKRPTGPVTIELSALPTPTNAALNGAVQVSLSHTTLVFTPENWDQWQTVTVTAIQDEVVDGSHFKAFGQTIRTLTGIRGPVYIEGGSGDPSVTEIPAPVMLPSETDAEPNGNGDGNGDEHDESNDVDILNIFHVDAVDDGSGVLTSTNLSGFGMGGDIEFFDGTQVLSFKGGINYNGVEIVEIFLGSGNETLAIESVAEHAITLVHGNAGDDTFIITAPAAEGAMLVVYGDTAASQTHRGAPGNDTIDTSGAGIDGIYYGGSGEDTIIGGSGNDWIAGGSGDDELTGTAGENLIWGDSGFDVDRMTRIVTVVTTGKPGQDDFDLPGNDVIEAGTGNDIVFGDHGIITQTHEDAVGNVLVHGSGVLKAETTNELLGGDDTITALGGRNLIFGGQGDDDITGGPGSDFIIGDNGQIDLMNGQVAVMQSRNFGVGGDDTIRGGMGNDFIIGGAGDDAIHGDAGHNMLFGDNARIEFANGLPILAVTLAPTIGGSDTIHGGTGNDLIVGGTGDDDLHGGAGNDLIFGDHAKVEAVNGQWIDLSLLPLAMAVHPFTFVSIFTQTGDGGGNDLIFGGPGDDIIIGGQGSNVIFGGAGDDDIIGGHNVSGGVTGDNTIDGGSGDDVIIANNGSILRRGDMKSPLYRLLDGTALFYLDPSHPNYMDPNHWAAVQKALNDGALDETLWQESPYGTPGRNIAIYDHWQSANPSDPLNTPATMYGNALIAGGPGHDMIFGGLGDDVIHGDGWIELVTNGDGAFVPELRNAVNPDSADPSERDGNDYIEGGGGNNVIFGGLGQDDIIGGSSSLFGLTDPAQRPSGSNIIFGGNGVDLLRESYGDGRHARDADVILGDNGNIYRPVWISEFGETDFLTFNYDALYGEAERIIPRTFDLLDYTAGTGSAADRGAADIIFGEGGNDLIHGMHGDNTIYGGAGDDVIYGGYGNNWISGGTGDDGIVGDDGMILISRNSSAYGEPLYGIAPLPASELNKFISTPGKIQAATINVANKLKYTAILGPFDIFNPYAHGGNDTIFGGLGDDAIHGGSGNDMLSGAEALWEFYYHALYHQVYLQHRAVMDGLLAALPGANDAKALFEYLDGGAGENLLPTPAILFNPATGVFDQAVNGPLGFDVNNPLAKIEGHPLNFDAWKRDPITNELLLVNGQMVVNYSGSNAIFGSAGHNWLVAGVGNPTGGSRLYGGLGNNILNGDNNLDTNGGLNNAPDPMPFAQADILFGGGGLDILIGNTGADRMIDWVGEFNSYIVPFSPFGAFTISRSMQPQLPEYLIELARSDGAHLAGRLYGELAIVRQQDPEWHDQTGAPRDPQPGNTPGVNRDVLRAADFSSGTADGFTPDSGLWEVQAGRLEVKPEQRGGDAVSVFYVDHMLPTYYEIVAIVNMDKPLAGYKANTYLIFDYHSPTDFKFAGLNASTNKLEIGRRTPQGWIVDKQSNLNIRDNRDYHVMLVVDGAAVTVVVDGQHTLSHTFAKRVIDGDEYWLNLGMVGIGADNSRGRIDSMRVQVATEFMLTPVKKVVKEQLSEETSDGADEPVEGPTELPLIELKPNVPPGQANGHGNGNENGKGNGNGHNKGVLLALPDDLDSEEGLSDLFELLGEGVIEAVVV